MGKGLKMFSLIAMLAICAMAGNVWGQEVGIFTVSGTSATGVAYDSDYDGAKALIIGNETSAGTVYSGITLSPTAGITTESAIVIAVGDSHNGTVNGDIFIDLSAVTETVTGIAVGDDGIIGVVNGNITTIAGTGGANMVVIYDGASTVTGDITMIAGEDGENEFYTSGDGVAVKSLTMVVGDGGENTITINGDSLTINNYAKITGATTAEGEITVGNKATFNYIGTEGIGDNDFTGLELNNAGVFNISPKSSFTGFDLDIDTLNNVVFDAKTGWHSGVTNINGLGAGSTTIVYINDFINYDSIDGIKGTVNMNKGAQLDIYGSVADYGLGNIHINLNNATYGTTTGDAAIDISATTVATGDLTATNSNLALTGGKVGDIYGIIETSGGFTNAEIQAIIKNSALLLYTVDDTGSAAGLHYVTVAANTAGINAATGGDPAKTAKLFAMMNNAEANQVVADAYMNATPEEIKILAKADMDCGDNQLAVQQMAIGAAQAFNTQLSQVFSFNTVSAALGGITNDSDNKSTSASAGGKPVTYQGVTGNADCYRWGGFIKGYGGFGEQASRNNSIGYSFGGVGLLTGIDYKIAQELSLGALFGYSWNKSTMKENFGSATDNLLRMGLYGSFNWEGFYANTAPTFGIHILETQRKFAALGVPDTKGNRTGFDFNWFNEVGYTFDIAGFLLTPNYSLAMTYMHDPKYTETGGDGVVNLAVGAYDSWSLMQNLGLKLGRVFCLNEKLSLLPEIWGGWEHEYLSGGNVSMAYGAVNNQAWDATVQRIASDRAVFGAGITTLISNRYEIFGRYDQKLWDGGYNTNFTVGVGVKF